MSTTLSLSQQFSAKSIAAIEADRVFNNTAPNVPYATTEAYVQFLLNMVMQGAIVSYAQQHSTGTIDDYAAGDIGYVAPPAAE